MMINSMLRRCSTLAFLAVCFRIATVQAQTIEAQAEAPDGVGRSFQIGIFYGPTPELTNDRQFRWIKRAHIDFIQFIEDAKRQEATASQKRNFQILDLAQKHGLTYYVGDPRVHGSDEDVRDLVETYKGHPATGGYYIVDEPGADALDWPAKTYQFIRALDPDRVPYVNLLPDFVYEDYEHNYVEKWIGKVGKENLIFLSFDNYPFLIDGSFRLTNFYNLDVIRRAGLKHGVRTSSYLQSVGIKGHYRRPTEHELRFSAFSNLAYGIKNLVWFTYNTPVGQPVEKFTSAIIDSVGKKTDLYRPFRRLNKQLHRIGSVLAGLDAVAVYHTGEAPGKGIVSLPADFGWQPANTNDQLIITEFRNPRNNRQYMMIVNKSLTEEKDIQGVLDANIKRVYRISDISGRKRAVRINGGRIEDHFLPGEGKLYLFETTKK